MTNSSRRSICFCGKPEGPEAKAQPVNVTTTPAMPSCAVRQGQDPHPVTRIAIEAPSKMQPLPEDPGDAHVIKNAGAMK